MTVLNWVLSTLDQVFRIRNGRFSEIDKANPREGQRISELARVTLRET